MLASDKLVSPIRVWSESSSSFLSCRLKILVVFGLSVICFYRTTAQCKSSGQIVVDSLNRVFREKQLTDFDQAKELAVQASKLSIEINYPEGQATALLNLGIIQYRNGNNKEAIEKWFAAIKIYDEKKLEKSKQYGLLFLRVAAAFHEENNTNAGLVYARKAITIAKSIKDQALLSSSYDELATHYTKVKLEDSALYYFHQALDLCESDIPKADIMNNLGIVHFYRGQCSPALDYFKKSLQVYRQAGAKTMYNIIFSNIGEVYHKLAAYRQAIVYLDSSEMFAKSLGASNRLIDIYLLKEKSFRALHSIDSSAYYFEKAMTLKDSVYNDTYKRELASVQTKLEVYQKDAENKLLSKDKDIAVLYRNLTMAALLFTASVLVFVLVNRKLRIQKRVRRKLELKVEERTREIRRASLQLQLALNRARVNSHFVFNVLNSIRYMVLLKEPLRASDHLAKLSSLMRYSLETSQLEGVPIQAELNMLEQYIQLERTRLDNKFNYRITSNVGDNILMPGMLIQPYVENAIIHGISPTEGNDLYLSLHIRQLGDILRVKIEDNGKGQPTTRSNDHNPMGTSLGNDRLQILSLLNNRKYNVQTRDLYSGGVGRRGMVVILDLPVLEHQHNPVEAAS